MIRKCVNQPTPKLLLVSKNSTRTLTNSLIMVFSLFLTSLLRKHAKKGDFIHKRVTEPHQGDDLLMQTRHKLVRIFYSLFLGARLVDKFPLMKKSHIEMEISSNVRRIYVPGKWFSVKII